MGVSVGVGVAVGVAVGVWALASGLGLASVFRLALASQSVLRLV